MPNGGGFAVQISYTLPNPIPEACDDTPWTIHVVVNGPGGSSASTNSAFIIIEDDVAPHATTFTATVTKSFSTTVATMTGEPGDAASQYAFIDWGDGSAATTGTVSSDGRGGF